MIQYNEVASQQRHKEWVSVRLCTSIAPPFTGSTRSTAFESQMRVLYVQLGRAYELGGQNEQALAVYDDLARLTSKQS